MSSDREIADEAIRAFFHPPEHLRDASAEQIVDEALKHRPIAL